MIKRLMKTDVDMVKDLLSNEGRVIASIENIEDFLFNNANYFLAFIDDNKIVGYLIAYVLQRYDGRNQMLYLHEIDVLESYRKRGIATHLMTEIKKICQKENYEKLFLITNKSNEAAVALYESCGGEVNAEDDVIYTFKG